MVSTSYLFHWKLGDSKMAPVDYWEKRNALRDISNQNYICGRTQRARPSTSLGDGVSRRPHSQLRRQGECSRNQINKHKSSFRKQQSAAETTILGEDKISEWGELWKNELIYGATLTCRARVFANRSQTADWDPRFCTCRGMPLWGETTKMAKFSLKIFAEFWAWAKKGQSQTPKKNASKKQFTTLNSLKKQIPGCKTCQKEEPWKLHKPLN